LKHQNRKNSGCKNYEITEGPEKNTILRYFFANSVVCGLVLRRINMHLFKKVPFSHEEKSYDIKVFYSDTLITVVAFHNNYPVNSFRHQITVSKKIPVRKLLENDVIDEIIQVSKRDIVERRSERLLAQP
jgi:hypothetical protein